jgi:hypothetical protein
MAALLVLGGIVALAAWVYGLAGGKDEEKAGNAALIAIVVSVLAFVAAALIIPNL